MRTALSFLLFNATCNLAAKSRAPELTCCSARLLARGSGHPEERKFLRSESFRNASRAEPNGLSRILLPMTRISGSPLSKFQLSASELRRDRVELHARLERLSRLCAETDKLNAESKARIARSLAVLDRSPSIIPDAQYTPEIGGSAPRRE
jgi:hypothetical protein